METVPMKTPVRSIGDHLRQMFASVIGRPLGWSQIDALATLEEREEAIEGTAAKQEAGRTTAPKPPSKSKKPGSE
jgi:hypothetical protein